MSNNFIPNLKRSSDAILSIREKLGVDLKKVYIVTRTWAGTRLGSGACVETITELRPTPGIKDLSNDYRVKDGGAVQAGDLMIRDISKNHYAQTDIDCSTSGKLVEKFFKIGTEFYTFIRLQEKQVTWNVQIRKRSDQRPVAEVTNG